MLPKSCQSSLNIFYMVHFTLLIIFFLLLNFSITTKLIVFNVLKILANFVTNI